MKLNHTILQKFANNFGDSFYLLDSKKFEANYDEFIKCFRNIYSKTNIAYSYKTNYIPKLCTIINNKGGYAEVVSEMEYDLAIKIGVSPKKIIVNGPYKEINSLERFLLNGSLVNLDSYYELDLIQKIAKNNPSKHLFIGLRCNFEIKKNIISRFGFDIGDKEFIKNFNKLNKIKNITIKGIHCHFPDRDLDSYIPRVNKLLFIINKLFTSPPEYIDIGGGFFGKMPESLRQQFDCDVPSYEEYAKLIATKFNDYYHNVDEKSKPTLFLEPGSAIVGDTMKFVAKIIDIKKIRGKNIAMTSGSKFNMGLLTSTINLPITVYENIINKFSAKNYSSIDLSGYTCIESDYLYKNYKGSLGVGDFIVFDNVGSYSIVFKPPFIYPNVAIIDFDSTTNKIEIVKNKETMEDIFKTYVFK